MLQNCLRQLWGKKFGFCRRRKILCFRAIFCKRKLSFAKLGKLQISFQLCFNKIPLLFSLFYLEDIHTLTDHFLSCVKCCFNSNLEACYKKWYISTVELQHSFLPYLWLICPHNNLLFRTALASTKLVIGISLKKYPA